MGNQKKSWFHPAHPAVPGECGGLYHPAGRAVLHDALHPLLQGSGHGLSWPAHHWLGALRLCGHRSCLYRGQGTGSAQSRLHSGSGAGLSGCIRGHPAGYEKSAGAGISGKSEAEVPENILNGQDPLRGRTLPAAGLFQKKRRFLVRSGKITTFLCFCNKCLLINYPSPVLAIHTLFVYNKDVRGSSQCAAPDEEQNSIPNEKNLRGVCYHGFR